MTLKQKIENFIIIASLKTETMGKLINRIPDSRLLISSLPGSALRMHVELLGKPCDVNKRSKSLADKLDIKRHSPNIPYLVCQRLSKSSVKMSPVALTCMLY